MGFAEHFGLRLKYQMMRKHTYTISRPMQQNQIAGNEDKGHLLENEM